MLFRIWYSVALLLILINLMGIFEKVSQLVNIALLP